MDCRPGPVFGSGNCFMRKPRDLDKYTDKASALAFCDEMRAMVEAKDDGTLFRLSFTFRNWHPDWGKKDG